MMFPVFLPVSKCTHAGILAVILLTLTALGGVEWNGAYGQVQNDSDFVTTWNVTSPGQSITIPAHGTYTINWGDGTVENVSGAVTHTYNMAGNYTVRISDGITQIRINYYTNALKLVSIDQWGDAQWTTMRSAFEGADNMVYRATDAPDLSGVTDMSRMFDGASSFNQDLSSWDVSSVIIMTGMFYQAASFNGDISFWDVSSVTDMRYMFRGTSSFNQDLSPWDVSSVTTMVDMFYQAGSFAQNLGSWYIVLDDTTISSAAETLAISAQNAWLDGQGPIYTVDGTVGSGALFEVAEGALAVKSGRIPQPGTHNVTITSTRGFGTGNSRVAEITVDVTPVNSTPTADAGQDQTVAEGSTTTLSGTASDPDPGDTLAYLWTQSPAAPR